MSIWSADTFLSRVLNFAVGPIHEVIALCRRPWRAKGWGPDLTGYSLVFEDNFSGDTLGGAWHSHGDGQRKGGYWDKAQARVEDGRLIIRTEYKEGGPYGAGWYSWGTDTKGTYERAHGYFEARCILPAAQGLWSAFWMFTDRVKKGVPGTRAVELDVMESPLWKSNRQRRLGLISQNIHYNGYGPGTRYRNVAVTRADRPYEQFNTYGLLWTPEEYIFYVNGRETGRSTYGGVCREPLCMLLSVEVDGVGGVPSAGWSEKITRNEKGACPADFVVDYVKVWAKQ